MRWWSATLKSRRLNYMTRDKGESSTNLPPGMTPTPARRWWQDAVFYQIYPLSFADSDDDGFGDLEGIISKLDYLSETLGVNAIWLSPFYKSPMADWGYDVSNHTDVDPVFGDLEVAERLIDEIHKRGMRVILDYLMNHTSIEHPWFAESRSSVDNPKRDWYVWRDPKPDGSEPNNWVSVFSGPAWTLDPETGQYYRHTFLPHQPDLNWRNPEVREAMFDVARFWLDRGVDGFRVDAAHQMMKDPRERDNPPAPGDRPRPWKDMGEYDYFIHLYDFGHPDVHQAHREFQAVLDEYPHEPFAIGEIHIFDLPEWAAYYGEHLDQIVPFNFHLMVTPWEADTVRATVESVLWHVPDGGWTNWLLGNHDEIRLVTRLGNLNARLGAMLLLTLRGTPFLYYGDELGLPETRIPAEDGRDPWGANVPYLSRDGCRTPMQWDDTTNSGFCLTTPWLPLDPEQKKLNVAAEIEDPGSMLSLYRRLIEYRKAMPALREGKYLTNQVSNEDVFVFERFTDDQRVLVALNMSDQLQLVAIEEGEVVVSTSQPGGRQVGAEGLFLGRREGVIIEVGATPG
jgi:glycosidase